MRRRQVELPKQWPRYVKSALLNAIAFASFAMSYTRRRATTAQRLRAELDQAKAEIEMLREEKSIKDGRWDRFPDFVRVLVRQLKALFPAMGHVRIAQTLARAGLRLSASTVRRIVREKAGPKLGAPVAVALPRRRRVVAAHPGHAWHLDLTVVPTRAGFWVPWFPYSAPQRWPFCWCVAVVVDQVSRTMVGFAVFARTPDSKQLQLFLERVIQSAGHTPRYIITDRGRQFWCRSYRRWCKRRGIRPRFGRLGEPSSICICERFIRSLKDECTRRLIGPLFHSVVRPVRKTRFETRPRMPGYGAERADRLDLALSYSGGRRHLPVIQLRRAA